MKIKRFILVIVGVLFAFALLESGLRLGGFVYLSIQESKNQRAMRQKGSYRILCLGDSTTENQWPPYLKDILNRQDLGIQFSVIDKGRSCTNSMHIMAELETNIEKYQPDMIITMMGANDGGYYRDITNIRSGTLKNLRIYKLFKMILSALKNKNQEVQAASTGSIKPDKSIIEITREKELNNLKNNNSLSTNELDVKLQLDKSRDGNEYVLMGRSYREQGKYEQAIKYFEKALKINSENDEVCCELAYCFKEQGSNEEAEAYLKQALKADPENDRVYRDLGFLFKEQGKYKEAEVCFKKATDINPMNDAAYSGLAHCFKDQNIIKQAIKYFQKALEINPENHENYRELGSCYRNQDKYKESEKYFQKALTINQDDEWNYIGLAYCLIELGKHEEAENCFRTALKINPFNDEVYGGLGRFFREQRKYEEAEKYFQKALEINQDDEWNYIRLAYCLTDLKRQEEGENYFRTALKINPLNEYAYEGLSRSCREQGRYEEAEKYLRKALEIDPDNKKFYEELGLCLMGQGKLQEAESFFVESQKITQMQGHRHYTPKTINNYIKLKKTLDKNNIQYVCVQYPMWDVELLKDIFREESGIIFVDNKKIFEDAVNQSSYCEYFIDAFGGNFGHCTDKGNRLLAENIAGAILQLF